MPRMQSPPGPPPRPPALPWFAGMAIGLTILGIASTAMALGATWALSGAGKRKQD